MAERGSHRITTIWRPIRHILHYLHSEPLQSIGAVLGGAGAWLLSQGDDLSKWGWVAFLLSNACLILMAKGKRLWGVLALQCYFVTTSINGIANYF